MGEQKGMTLGRRRELHVTHGNVTDSDLGPIQWHRKKSQEMALTPWFWVLIPTVVNNCQM